MTNIYTRWDEKDVVEKFAQIKQWSKRFRSEVFFLEKIMKSGMSILDVGCAVGDLYHGLRERGYGQLEYLGTDVAEKMIERARKLDPGVQFICGNFIEDNIIANNQFFDVVTATGVFQHEPNTYKLLENMVKHTKDGGYLLFDVKFFHTHATLCDIEKSRVDVASPLFFIVFRINEFLSSLIARTDVVDLQIYGYYSGVNVNVKLPSDVTENVCSAHVLLKKGQRNNEVSLPMSINLPVDFMKNYLSK